MNRSPSSRRQFLHNAALGTAALLATPALRAAGAASAPASLTMLNSMAGPDFEAQCVRQAGLGLRWLDLKDYIWGEAVDSLALDKAERVVEVTRKHQLGIFCLSTQISSSSLAEGEAGFRRRHLATADHVIKVAGIVKPQCIRMMSALLKPFPADGSSLDVVEKQYPWIFDVYREIIDRMTGAGHRVLLENDSKDVVLNRPDNIHRFFTRLDRPGKVRYTWDVTNLWEMGVFPSLEVYRELKPLIGCVHVKGGRTEGAGRALVHASSLEDASWPVLDILRAVIADGVSPVICLNPSHGKLPAGFDVWDVAQRDVAFLRRELDSRL